MPERELKKKPAPARRSEEVEETPANTEAGEKIKAELDDLLDEIDDVLETNAEDFVKSYIQKAGSNQPMAMPFFTPGDDPGPDFAELLRRTGSIPPAGVTVDPAQITHGTTCVAIRYSDGVVMAGDRRATSGNWISNRRIEKVFPADRYSGVAIAGAAGPAVEMVRLFQLQLEHYEKVEGSHLSLEGKANQLSQMIRNNLPAAMSGMAVVPIFAGYDTHRGVGRLFQYDITGGRYEDADHTATGSGQMHASTVVKLGWKPDLDREQTIDLALRGLWEAADEDSATGGPDLIRKIYPIVATITADGFTRVDDEELAERFRALIDRLEGGDNS